MTGFDGPRELDLAPPSELAEVGEVSVISAQERDLLCALSYVHLACGQSTQGVALLRLTDPEQSQDIGLLRILAYGLIAEGAGDEALAILDRLEVLDDRAVSRQPMMLMRSHALRRAGRMDEARLAFQAYVSLRAGTKTSLHPKAPR